MTAGSGVQQLHIAYIPVQDRLLLRVGTVNQVEVRMWLTRRLVQTALWPALQRLLQSDPAVATQADERTKQEVLSFQHQEAVAQTKFTKQYQPPPEVRPLSQTPLLITRIGATPLADGLTRIAFVSARGRSIQLAVGRPLAHSLSKLIVDCTAKAKWDLALKLPEQDLSAPEEPGTRTIN